MEGKHVEQEGKASFQELLRLRRLLGKTEVKAGRERATHPARVVGRRREVKGLHS